MADALPAFSLRNDIAARRVPEVDTARIERAMREILIAVGENPDREGLLDTPARVARAYKELLSGLREDAGVHLRRQFDLDDDAIPASRSSDLVMVRDIEFASTCEHHFLPFTGRAHVAYLPSGGRVVGLSKMARTVDVFARRPQMQERLTSQVADAIVEHLDPLGVAVIVEAEHSCMRLRGAKKAQADMLTTAFRGCFERDREQRAEAVALLTGRSAPR